jgi:hypothetical protein
MSDPKEQIKIRNIQLDNIFDEQMKILRFLFLFIYFFLSTTNFKLSLFLKKESHF